MEPGLPKISDISASTAHQGGLVVWYGHGRPVVYSDYLLLGNGNVRIRIALYLRVLLLGNGNVRIRTMLWRRILDE